MIMYTKGHSNLAINIEQIKNLPFIRYETLNINEWPESRYYSKEKITDSLCSDKTAEDLKLEWDWTNQYRPKEWKMCGLAFYKLSPGHVTPWHVDHYENFSNYYKVDKKDIIRRMIFLEDWQPGQIFCIERETISNWLAGDWIEWTYEHRHMGANHSDSIRYTMQLTGIRL